MLELFVQGSFYNSFRKQKKKSFSSRYINLMKQPANNLYPNPKEDKNKQPVHGETSIYKN